MTEKASWAQRHRRLLVASASGAMFALTAPPTDFYPCAILGLGGLAYAVQDSRSGWRGFGRGLVWGSSAGLVGLRFVPSVIMLFTDLGTGVALLAHVLLSIAQSVIWAIGMAVTASMRRRLRTPLWLAFGVGIMVALSLPSVFLWSPAGLISPWPRLIQAADLIGERGVSVLFGVVMVMALQAWQAHARERDAEAKRNAGIALGIVVALAAYGTLQLGRYGAPTASRAKIGLVHAGIDPKFRWVRANAPLILKTLRDQTKAAEAAGAELSIWPEAAYPYPLRHDHPRAPTGGRAIHGRGVKGPVLFGLIGRDPIRKNPDGSLARDSYNSATLLTPKDGKLQPSYDKMVLLWFGETVPLSDKIDWLRRTFQRSGGLIPGKEIRALRLDRGEAEPLTMGVLNCYEDTLPDLGRRVFHATDPNLLVNVTNDAWFVGTAAPRLHVRLSAMRAIELRRDLVRSVNLGVAAWIDASGTVRAENDSPKPGVLMAEPSLRSGETIYSRFGDWPMALLMLCATAGSVWRRRQSTVSGAPP